MARAEHSFSTRIHERREGLLSNWAYAAALAVILAGGLALRLVNLGSLGLLASEGHTFVAARAVADQGVPILPSGLWYLRAVPVSYFTAPFLLILGDSELAVRLPSAIFGLGTVLLGYVIGRDIFKDRSVGLFAAAILAFHPWQIEMSRFAREYASLQFLDLAAALVLWKGFIEERLAYRVAYPPVVFFVLATSVFGAPVALYPLALLLLKGLRRLVRRDMLIPLVIGAMAASLAMFFRIVVLDGNSVDHPAATLPGSSAHVAGGLSTQGPVKAILGALSTPSGDLPSRFLYLVPVVAIVLGVFAAGLAVSGFIRQIRGATPLIPDAQRPALFFLICFMLSMAVLTIVDSSKSRFLYSPFGLAAVVFAFVAVHGLRLIASGQAVLLNLLRARLELVANVNVALPSALISKGVITEHEHTEAVADDIAQVQDRRRQRLRRAAFLFPVLALLCLLALVVVVIRPDESAKIPFRTYSDAIPDRQFFGREINDGFSPEDVPGYRPDLKTTAQYVAARREAGDVIVVIGVPEAFTVYLHDQIDYRVCDIRGPNAATFVDDGVPRNRYTGIAEIDRVEDLRAIVASNSRVWIVVSYSLWRASHVPPAFPEWFAERSDNMVYEGLDGHGGVWLFEAGSGKGAR